MGKKLDLKCERCNSPSLKKKKIQEKRVNETFFLIQECRCIDCGHITEYEVKVL